MVIDIRVVVKEEAHSLRIERYLLKENERSLREIGFGCSVLARTKDNWRADVKMVVDHDRVKLIRDSYKPGHCLGLNWICVDADTSYSLKLPCYTAACAMLGSDHEPILVDSPPSPAPCGRDSCCQKAFESFTVKFGGNDPTRMLVRVTIGHLFEHISLEVPGLTPLNADGDGICALIAKNYNADHARVFDHRLSEEAKNLAIPKRAKSAYQLFFAQRMSQLKRAEESSEASDPHDEPPEDCNDELDEDEAIGNHGARKDRVIQQEWRTFQKQQAGGGGGEYELAAAEERRRIRPLMERWLKAYHQEMPPVAPWLEEAMLPLAAGAGKKAKFRHVLSDAAAVVPQAPPLLAPPIVAQALTLKEFTEKFMEKGNEVSCAKTVSSYLIENSATISAFKICLQNSCQNLNPS